MSEKDQNELQDIVNDLDTEGHSLDQDVELFSEELEDRFNAKSVSSASSASSAGSCYGSFSTFCSTY